MSLRRDMNGFTFVELMTTLLIISVVAAWAVPSFLEMIRGNRAQVQAAEFLRTLNYARSEAVRRNSRVYITSLNGDKDWGVKGWRVWVDRNNDAVYQDTDIDLQERAALSGGATLGSPDGVSEIIFLGNGFINRSLTDDPVIFEYRVSEQCGLGKDIELMPVGRASMTAKGC